MQTPPMIAGLYRYVRGGELSARWDTPDEIRLNLEINPWCWDRLTVLAEATSPRTCCIASPQCHQ